MTYESECEERDIDTRNGLLAGPDTPAQFVETREFVKLPNLRPELAKELVAAFSSSGKTIPLAPTEVSTGASALVLTTPTNGQTIGRDTDVIGSVQPGNLSEWRLELGREGSPSEWIELGSGDSTQSDTVLGRIEVEGLEDGVYTLRATARDQLLGNLSASVTVNIRPGGA